MSTLTPKVVSFVPTFGTPPADVPVDVVKQGTQFVVAFISLEIAAN